MSLDKLSQTHNMNVIDIGITNICAIVYRHITISQFIVQFSRIYSFQNYVKNFLYIYIECVVYPVIAQPVLK